MAKTEREADLLNALENMLVSEFRACQALQVAARDERAAMVANDLSVLLALAERKELLLDELSRLDDTRRMITQQLGSLYCLPNSAPTVADILPFVEPQAGSRIGHLRTGILALMKAVRNLTRGNEALAAGALEREDYHLNELRTKHRGRQHQVQPTTMKLNDSDLALKGLLHQEEEASMPEVISKLRQQETVFQTVLEVSNRTLAIISLFDYLS